MKIKMKRLFGIMLSLVLVLGLTPVTSLTAYAGGGTYSATFEADSAVNSNNLTLEISFLNEGGNSFENRVVTIYPEKGERKGSDNGGVPSGAKSVKLKVVTAGNLVDFNSSSITISGKKVNDISGITDSLVLNIKETDTLAISIKVVSNNQGGQNSGQGSGDNSQGSGDNSQGSGDPSQDPSQGSGSQ